MFAQILAQIRKKSVLYFLGQELILPRLSKEVNDVMQNLAASGSWEVIYVNDGSADQSLELLKGIQRANPKNVVIVDLSRNWGHQAAITAGLSLARGDGVVIMDGDLQDPPELIPDMVAAWKTGAEVVIARRRSRGEGRLRRLLFTLFYRTLGYLSDYPIPLSSGIFGLLDRKVCAAIIGLQETNRFLPGLRSWVGFRTAFVEFDRPDRAAGKPKQTLGRLVKYGLDAILSFSYKPQRLGLAFGMGMAAAALAAGVILAVMRISRHWGIIRDTIVLGYASLMCVVVLMASVQLI
jgi:polyisoprenyl-phosphate glycosyltransferase